MAMMEHLPNAKSISTTMTSQSFVFLFVVLASTRTRCVFDADRSVALGWVVPTPAFHSPETFCWSCLPCGGMKEKMDAQSNLRFAITNCKLPFPRLLSKRPVWLWILDVAIMTAAVHLFSLASSRQLHSTLLLLPA